MKKIINIIFLAAVLTVAGGCRLDNYEAPGGCIYGSIIDAGTGEPIPLPVEGSTGAVVSLMEIGTGASLAQSFYAKSDGSFRNALVFDGEYSVTARGPFRQTETCQVTINGETRQDITAVPYSRIAMEVTRDGASVTVSFEVAPTDAAGKVTKTYVLWNYRKQTDITAGNNAGSRVNFSGAKTGSHTFNFEKETQYVKNIDKIRENGNRVYVRVAAECGGQVNYSKIHEITL